MSKGKVIEYNASQGYGSINDSDTGRILTVYANFTDLKAGEFLKTGQEVEYQIEKQRGEDWAIHVKIL